MQNKENFFSFIGCALPLIMVTFIMTATVWLVWTNVAYPHDWYSDQRNPQTFELCCGGEDCAPIANEAVERRLGGWLYKSTKEFIPDQMTSPSPDGRFHACTVMQSPFEKGNPFRTRCFFVPQNFGS